MEMELNLLFRAATGLFGCALIKRGITSLKQPEKVAEQFGLPLRSAYAADYVPAMGIREIGTGTTLLVLLVADFTTLIMDGKRSIALVMAASTIVGIGDGLLVYCRIGKGGFSHFVGSTVLLTIASGLWLTS